MDKYDIEFCPSIDGRPYIQTVYDYTCDGEHGSLEFNGYYYVDDENESRFDRKLPKEEILRVKRTLDVPTRTWRCQEESFLTDYSGKKPLVEMEYTEYTVDKFVYKVLVERREKIQNTDVYSTVEDGDEGEMEVCFFPTDHQRIFFRVLETLVSEKSVKSVGGRQISAPIVLDFSHMRIPTKEN